jgi:hypothetical protein
MGREHKTHMELPKCTLSWLLMFHWHKLLLLYYLIWNLTKCEVVLCKQSKAKRFPVFIETYVDGRIRTRTIIFDYCWFQLHYSLNCCVATPLIQFSFSWNQNRNRVASSTFPKDFYIVNFFIERLSLKFL